MKAFLFLLLVTCATARTLTVVNNTGTSHAVHVATDVPGNNWAVSFSLAGSSIQTREIPDHVDLLVSSWARQFTNTTGNFIATLTQSDNSPTTIPANQQDYQLTISWHGEPEGIQVAYPTFTKGTTTPSAQAGLTTGLALWIVPITILALMTVARKGANPSGSVL